MGLAKVCDRCGKLYLPYHKDSDQFGGSLNAVQGNYTRGDGSIRDRRANLDLCPDCMESFLEWLNPEPVTKKEEE